MNTVTQPISIETIISSVARVSFSQKDIDSIVDYMTKCRTNGLDLVIDTSSKEEMKEMVSEGLLLLQSQDLKSDFLFVNVDAGKGFLGGQKARIATFTSDIYRGEFFPGPVLDGIVRALVGINNIYRSTGILKGGAY